MKHQSSKSRHGASMAILVLMAAGALAGCDDENLFRTDVPPKLNEFAATAPSVVEGDTATFTVDARGPRTIRTISLTLSGAMTGEVSVAVDEPSTRVSQIVRLPIPQGTGPGSTLTVTARAIDMVPDTSEAKTATIELTDGTPPTVSAEVTPEQAAAGDTISIAITASDNRGLARIGAVVTDSLGYDTIVVQTVGSDVLEISHTLLLQAPSLDLGTLVVTPFAIDVNGLRDEAVTTAVSLSDRKGPTFVSLQTSPDSTIPLGDSLRVEVEVADPSGIRRVTFIGLAYRGDPSMGTDSVVERFGQRTITFPRPTEGEELPTRYTLAPYLHDLDKETPEDVEIQVVAEDGLGNVSDTTKVMFIGGPSVDIVFPPRRFGVRMGAEFDVRVAIHDPTAIDSARLYLSNGVNESIRLQLPARTDTPFVVVQTVTMPDTEGEIEMYAQAWNRSRLAGQSRVVIVSVHSDAVVDEEPPTVSLSAQRLVPGSASQTRMELSDALRITVSAFDANSGLARIGLKAVVARGADQQDTVTVTEQRTFTESRSLEQLVFEVSLDSLYDRLGVPTSGAVRDSILPETLDLWVHGFAADEAGNVACAVGLEEQRPCSPDGYDTSAFYEAADTAGLALTVDAVRGVTVMLTNPAASIADLAIDTIDERVFLSNISQNLVEVLRLQSTTAWSVFAAPIKVGSEPLGLFVGERVVTPEEVSDGVNAKAGDIARTLLVANSGGTNVSMVHLDPKLSNVQEVDAVRLRTQNAVLFEVEESEDDSGFIRYLVEYIDLADRPQYLAQDSLLRIVFSTVPTGAAPLTTVRIIHGDTDPTSADDEPEVRFLLTSGMVDTNADEKLVLANIDSLGVGITQAGNDGIIVYTHEPGYPDRVISNPTAQTQVSDAVDYVIQEIQAVMDARGIGNQGPMFYPFYRRGAWDLGELTWADTTYVSASGDRGKIVIGEGARTPTGRIMMWHASERAELSDAIQIRDLVNNASEEVLGLGLNQTGTLGVARGREATYFFTPDLRLQGLYRQAHSGGAGAALHPRHRAITDGGQSEDTGRGVAFTGTTQNSIEVVNTFHFNGVNELIIRDNIVGPLRAGPPLAADNNGRGDQCLQRAGSERERKDCIVAKLYGVTSAGGVVIVNVRRRDLEPYANP